MKYIIFFTIIVLQFSIANGRNAGETEITTDDGIEVFQDKKYYHLKKNVKINSDDFDLFGDDIKIFFENDLYDIKIIDAVNNVKLESLKYNINASGINLKFKIESEEINISGIGSELITDNAKMFSDGVIQVNNLNGKFFLKGKNSKLESKDIFIEGNNIDGQFSSNNEIKEILYLNVYDEKISHIITEDAEMFAKKINYNKDTSIIDLEYNVKIIRDGETVSGDKGVLNMNNNSYKIKSNDTQKVKVVITNKDE